MKKKVAVLILVLLAMGAAFLGSIFFQGYVRYKREIRLLDVKEAVRAYTEKSGYVKFEEMDPDFVNAVICVEDKRYFSRKGYEFIALFRALYHNFQYRDFVEGGSTIVEQIAKNLYMEGYVDSLEEKIAEICIMADLEKTFDKESLFALYANMNYYGDGFWGIEQASQGYFGKNCDDLTLAEAAILAGIPNAPAVYQLSSGYEEAKERQSWVLLTMLNNGIISEEEMDAALKEDVRPVNIKKES